jgi:bifunctional non-homologous end joining protein LigD
VTDTILTIDGKDIQITHAERVLWPQPGITKLQYITYLASVAQSLLAYTKDRMLMIWRYPGGITGRRIEERSIHGPAPEWVPRVMYNGKERILLNNLATLVYVANLGGCELHVPFDMHYRKDYPTELVFDLDPPDGDSFGLVLEVALKLREVLNSLSLYSFPKTSGATGMQIFVPIEPKYTFEQTRRINRFIAEYMLGQMPDQITLERATLRRGSKLYFDYLQLWRGRTMAAPYSVRAQPLATVSTPLMWMEAERGVAPADFTIGTVPERLRKIKDPFLPVLQGPDRLNQNLDEVLAFVETHG